jgi:biotin transport system substrate-specific component
MKKSAVLSYQRKNIIRITLTALFAALIAAGNFISIPLPGSPVPIAIQNLFALLSGMLLGPLLGGAAVGFYLVAGAIGAPVFAGATSGFARFLGPTGGFLIGYLLSAVVSGLIAGRPRADYKTPLWRLILAAFAGLLSVYIPGIIWLKFAIDLTWQEAIAAGFLPFIIGDAVKGSIAVLVAPRLRQTAADHLDG